MDVGLSILMGLQATALFLIFVSLQNLDFTLLSLPFLYASLVSLLVSLASHPSINIPTLLCKKQDGTFPIWSLIIFSPYLYLVRIFSFLRRFTSGEEPYNEICEGVYIGGWPYSVDKLPPGNPAIIDCTCEFPRKEEFKGHSYLCLATWDTRAPQPGEIESAVKWASRKRAQNVPVFIHCAYGHGRSVAVMCALLVALGVVEDWKKAELFIRERRPYISMNSVQYKALEEWSKHRLSTSSIDEVSSSSAVPSTSSGRPRAGRPKNRSG
ncbi:PREDICTED: uncharacterized protein LOC105131550 isoform X1 [Populus euphratica]|uniref:Uncharacterized protein LOC105131550 isoform X1 n=1 Tax=Populus euphratica TaxID=75702 RepID=A0AAJ6XVT6_POPEU|nr:PREDICTED: uncharacterized protein LOC105131550 isoform X1 [Populus euphratica]